MLKLTVGVCAVALSGTASAERWRELRVDGSSEAAFEQSLEVFNDKLSPARRYVFSEALKDILLQGANAAKAENREYTADDYYRQLDGLRYEEIVTFTDPTGDTAKARYRDACLTRPGGGSTGMAASAPWPSQPAPIGFQGQQVRGGDRSRYPLQ